MIENKLDVHCLLCEKESDEMYSKNFFISGACGGVVTLHICNDCIDYMVCEALAKKFWGEIEKSPKVKMMLENAKKEEEE